MTGKLIASRHPHDITYWVGAMTPKTMESLSVLRFGTFEVDLQTRELRKGGIRIRLQDQPFAILAMMLERPGRLVTREELQRKLWPDGMFVDFEHSLNAAVKRLRAALGDEADNPRFVETLHRRGYRFIAPVDGSAGVVPGATPDRAAALEHKRNGSGAADEKVRLAVLPFTNIGDDAGQEYFSDGLTEEMIVQVGRMCSGRLAVIARTSAMLFKRSAKSVREIGKDLRVDYVLEGSVRREADLLRITAQLIDTSDETHLWSESYDRRLEDYFTVQSDVAARIAQSLALELVPGQRESSGRGSSRKGDAYQAYLKGRFHWNKTGDEGLEQAVLYYEQALALDPEFAAAHAALARAKLALADYWTHPAQEALRGVRPAALRSLELDPGLPEGHLALAEVRKSLDWDWGGAESEYRRAVAFGPNCEGAHRAYAVFLAAMLRPRDARVPPLGDRSRPCRLILEMDPGDERDTGLLNVRVEPRFETLRGDSRYARLLRRLGFEA